MLYKRKVTNPSKYFNSMHSIVNGVQILWWCGMCRHEVWMICTKVLEKSAELFHPYPHAEEQRAVSSKMLAIMCIQNITSHKVREYRIYRDCGTTVLSCVKYTHRIMYVSRALLLAQAYQLPLSPILGMFVNCRYFFQY
jgi:hypothetical protein